MVTKHSTIHCTDSVVAMVLFECKDRTCFQILKYPETTHSICLRQVRIFIVLIVHELRGGYRNRPSKIFRSCQIESHIAVLVRETFVVVVVVVVQLPVICTLHPMDASQ